MLNMMKRLGPSKNRGDLFFRRSQLGRSGRHLSGFLLLNILPTFESDLLIESYKLNNII